MAPPIITPWPDPEPPTEPAILKKFTSEGLEGYLWSNGPYDTYPSHDHPYHKVLYVIFGSITFGVEGRKFSLHPGDRLDLPPGVVHDARVGPQGVVCVEAQK